MRRPILLAIGAVIATHALCADDVSVAEAAYFQALEQSGTFSATTAKLKLGSTDSAVRLVYSPAASPR